jgi:hypothetical protein
MALAKWPIAPHSWLDDYIIWRFKGSPSPKPSNIPDKLGGYPYAGEVLTWCTWQRKGKPQPRPDVCPNIPDWAFDLLKQLNAAVPIALPGSPVDWLLPWAITRFKNQPKPDAVPDDFSVRYPYVWSALRWFGWQRKGAPSPRPTNVPEHIPPIYWNLLTQLNIAVPLEPPPPPPDPANPIPENSWKLRNPLIYTAWGWQVDWRTPQDINMILSKWASSGFGTVALQIGMFPVQIPDAVRSFGMDVALWGEADSRDGVALENADAEGYIPQIEGVSQYQNTINNLQAGIGQGLSLSTVTTLSGIDTFIRRPNGTPEGELTTVQVETLVDLGLTHASLECYTGDMRPIDVGDFVWSAHHRGFYHVDPVMGLARPDVFVSSYQPDIDAHGKQFGSYLAEPMRDIDYNAIKNLG